MSGEKFSENQKTASDPSQNVWVQANAGTGKTAVLTRRLLRIFFRNERYSNSETPGILCLTYTKAGASEMRQRILKDLQTWAMADDDKLSELLIDVADNNPATPEDLAYAREIFYKYIDNPDVLKIKTIHSFCEEILHRFSIEAGLSPSWTLISDSTQNVLMENAFERMISKSFNQQNFNERTVSAFDKIVATKSEYFLDDLRKLLISRYSTFFKIENIDKYREYFIENTKKILKIDSEPDMSYDPAKLQAILNYAKNEKSQPGYIKKIINLTEQYIDNTIDFEKYKFAYLTGTNETKIANVMKKDELVEECTRVYNINQYLGRKNIFENTIAMFDLATDFAKTYKQIKNEFNVLDFDDLILYTERLFKKPDVMGWVLSQLDISLGHILVDEAQDTSPQQWNILRMLAGDFMTDGDTQTNRSIFVVGDTKQSIFGFQGADPDAFAESREKIAQQIENDYRIIRDIPLDQNYRSVAPILDTVDHFFNNQEIISLSDFHNNNHKSHRQGEHGFVEMHALEEYEETGREKQKKYAKTLANKIEAVIKATDCQPKDIMVLVKNRSAVIPYLSLELKNKNIDVAGSDRIKLPEFPAIKDLLYTIRFCLDSTDDYSLCCVLKSPIYRLKEVDIYNLCMIKKEKKKNNEFATVFTALKDAHPDIYDDLQKTIFASQSMGPYSFFSYILNKNDNRKKIISALGHHVIDPLEEFMSMCLAYERTQPGTLRHFLKWFITGESEIKRDMDASQGIRIMTIHGSKGLASPIVFLIDTLLVQKKESLLNLNDEHTNPNYDLWIWDTSSSKTAPEIITELHQKDKRKHIAEYYRLLYVAMTRACNQLYIYGCANNKASQDSWHYKLWDVLSNISDAKIDETTIRIDNDTKIE